MWHHITVQQYLKADALGQASEPPRDGDEVAAPVGLVRHRLANKDELRLRASRRRGVVDAEGHPMLVPSGVRREDLSPARKKGE